VIDVVDDVDVVVVVVGTLHGAQFSHIVAGGASIALEIGQVLLVQGAPLLENELITAFEASRTPQNRREPASMPSQTRSCPTQHVLFPAGRTNSQPGEGDSEDRRAFRPSSQTDWPGSSLDP
jgi:hypothetical protein